MLGTPREGFRAKRWRADFPVPVRTDYSRPVRHLLLLASLGGLVVSSSVSTASAQAETPPGNDALSDEERDVVENHLRCQWID